LRSPFGGVARSRSGAFGDRETLVDNESEEGEKGVKNLRKNQRKSEGGRRKLLNNLQLEKLASDLESPPPDEGIWTGPKVARWIEKETSLEKVWNQRGWDYLKKQKYSWQSPRPKHKKGDELAQKEFKTNLPIKIEELKKKYVYGFVNPKTGETLWYLIPRVNTLWLNKVFDQFAKDVGISEEKKVLLVEDNAGWHSSKKVEIPSGIIIDYLPPYSPELQPAERLWKLVDEPRCIPRHKHKYLF
jgi:transposase